MDAAEKQDVIPGRALDLGRDLYEVRDLDDLSVVTERQAYVLGLFVAGGMKDGITADEFFDAPKDR